MPGGPLLTLRTPAILRHIGRMGTHSCHDGGHHQHHGHGAHAHAAHGAHPHTGHSHAGHAHAAINERRAGLAALMTGAFMLAEVVGGLLAGSLALLADAAHMLTDAVALGLAWFAFRLAARPASRTHTYGFDRAQVLVAFANGISLFVITLWIVVEAVQRLRAPVEVLGWPMLWIAAAGLLVNIGAFAALHGADRENLNIRGAMLHVAGDLLGSLGALIAAGVILLTGWMPIDPILSVIVACIILRSAWHLVHESAHILLEGTPKGIRIEEIGPDLVGAIDAVEDVHHVHVWSLTQERPLVTLHARICSDADGDRTTRAITDRLRERHGIDHVTVQIERESCPDGPREQPRPVAAATGRG